MSGIGWGKKNTGSYLRATYLDGYSIGRWSGPGDVELQRTQIVLDVLGDFLTYNTMHVRDGDLFFLSRQSKKKSKN